MIDVIILIVLVAVMCFCTYNLGYYVSQFKHYTAQAKIIDDLDVKLDKYTSDTFGEKEQAFFDEAHWVLKQFDKYMEQASE